MYSVEYLITWLARYRHDCLNLWTQQRFFGSLWWNVALDLTRIPN